jgi:hypothetical protein
MKTGIVYIVALAISLSLNLLGLKNVDFSFYGFFILVITASIYLSFRISFNDVLLSLFTLSILHIITRHAIDFWLGYETSTTEQTITPSIKLIANLFTLISGLALCSVIYYSLNFKNRSALHLTNINWTKLELFSLVSGFTLLLVTLPLAIFKDYLFLDFPFLLLSIILCLIGIFLGLSSLKRTRSESHIKNLGLIINGYMLLLMLSLRLTQ